MSLSSDDNLESWIRLWRVPGIGPQAFEHLLAHFGTAADALSGSTEEWARAGVSRRYLCAPEERSQDISPELRWLEAPENHILRRGKPGYPERLATIAAAPPLLYVKGDPSLLSHPQLAIVGSRNPSRGGKANARAFAEHLASAGLGITSGLALGIDAQAHEGALHAQGITLAVAATGLDRVYPARHRALAGRIVSEGAMVSELPIGTQVAPGNFPRRNRIISGLSLGTLVVEAARQSGSLITARYANEQGREVFAIPGSIHNPLARGCHQLLREGAKLVETADDILQELGPLLHTPGKHELIQEIEPEVTASNTPAGEAELLKFVDFEPTPVDMIIIRSGLTAEKVSSMLLIMELNGLVASEPGGYYIRLGSNP